MSSPRILQLQAEIEAANEAYYNQDTPTMSDYEYDQKVKELKQLDPSNPALSQMGGAVFGAKVQRHLLMGSLQKSHTADEVTEVFANIEKQGKQADVFATPKIDGCSLSVMYKYRKSDKSFPFEKATTRGSGMIGEDVSSNAVMVNRLPEIVGLNSHPQYAVYCGKNTELQILPSEDFDRIEVRGEVYSPLNIWNAEFSSNWKNPRNFAAGSLRQKDPKVTESRKIHFIAYRIIIWKGSVPCHFVNKETEFSLLKELGFDTPEFKKFFATKSKIEDCINDWSNRSQFNFEVDGIVFQVNRNDLFIQFGGMDDSHPACSTAWKYDTDKQTTTVLDIEWKTSRTGKIVPVAKIIPVQLAGTTVSRVTMNNLDFLRKNCVQIGGKIDVEKANEIIPKLVSSHRTFFDRAYINYPDKCPSCGEKTKEDVVNVRCENSECPAQVEKKMLHFIKALNIKGFSTSFVNTLLSSDLLEDKHFFDITEEDLRSIGIGAKNSSSWIKIINNIAISKAQFLTSLGIAGVGQSSWEKVLEVHDFDDVVELKILPEDLMKIIGPTTGLNAYKGLKSSQMFIAETLPHLHIKEDAVASSSSSSKLNGLKFCITGTLSEKRTVIEDLIKANGGTVGSVSRDLDVLIVGADPGSKLTKAKSLGIRIINEIEFRKMIK